MQLEDLVDSVRRVTHRKRAQATLRWTIAPDLDIGLQVGLVQHAGCPTVWQAHSLQPLDIALSHWPTVYVLSV